MVKTPRSISLLSIGLELFLGQEQNQALPQILYSSTFTQDIHATGLLNEMITYKQKYKAT
jgi:hypothetical protein